MKKIIILMLSFSLFACAPTKTVQLNPKVVLDYFYIDTCADCKVFKKKSIPEIKKTFTDTIEINQYDLDDEKTKEIYDPIVDSLDNFDELLYGQGPFIVVEGYFAVIGFDSSETDVLIEDIQAASEGRELSTDLEIRRYYFK